jgi:uracil-DNA glycosylase
MARRLQLLRTHVDAVRGCHACPQMVPPAVTGTPVLSPVMLIGQAPGAHEGPLGRPFAWTAGKTLFAWLGQIGLIEAAVRARVYMAAVCRCFPGKTASGGDRVPSTDEIQRCAHHLVTEVSLVQPSLVLPVGRLAITQILQDGTGSGPLAGIIGKKFRTRYHGRDVDVIPLPHPSGVSSWPRIEPGKSLLAQALALIAGHAAWQQISHRELRA